MINETSMNTTQKINTYLIQIILLIPLIFGGNTKELFEFPKTTIMYILGGITIFLFLFDSLGKKTVFKVPSIFAVMFLMSNILSTGFSTQKHTSLWGYYSRFNGGLISTVILFGLYLVISNNKDFYKKMLTKLPILTILPISLYAIFQHFNGVSRVYSTLGQPNWLAAYLVMIIPLILRKYLKGESKMLFFYLLAFSSLWFTYSLSGIIGFFVSGIFVYIQNKPISKKKFAILLGLTLLIALTNQGIFKEKTQDLWIDVKKQLTLVREVQASQEYALSDPGFIRLAVWRGTLNLIFSSPKVFLIGTGPQTYPYEFQKYRPQELNYSSEWNFIINRPHNYYLELESEVGIIGLVTYILFLAQNRKSPFLPSIAGYAVTNLFGWPVVPTALLFWLWAGYSLETHKNIEIKTHKLTKILPILLILPILYKATNAYIADVNFIKSLTKLRENRLDLSLKYAKKAAKENPREPNYYKQIARIEIASTAKILDSQPVKNAALENLKKAYDLNPKNLATKRDILSLYFYLASNDLTLPAGENNKDPIFSPIAEEYFSNLKKEYPTDAGTLADIAKYEKTLFPKGYNETRELVEKLRPDLLNWHESFR